MSDYFLPKGFKQEDYGGQDSSLQVKLNYRNASIGFPETNLKNVVVLKGDFEFFLSKEYDCLGGVRVYQLQQKLKGYKQGENGRINDFEIFRAKLAPNLDKGIGF